MFDLLMRLVENSVVMSVVIIVMLVLARVTRASVSARLRYACWVIIAVGLLLPIRPVLFTVPVPEMPDIVRTGGNTEEQMPPGTLDIAYAGEMFHIETNVAEGYATYIEESHYPGSAAIQDAVHGFASSETIAMHSQSVETEIHTTTREINWQALVVTLWGVGTLAFLLVCGVRHTIFMKNIRRWARPCADTSADEMLDTVCHAVGVRRPRLMVCPLVATPLVVGSIRPILILPEGAIEPTQLRLMLLHEVMHIRRGDNAIRLLSLVTVAVHWFNPLVYLMSRALQTEAELACDAAVLRHAGDAARMEYGQTIFSTAKRTQKLSALASAMSGEGKNLKRRLANIIEKKRTRRGIALACAVLMIGAVLVAAMLSYEERRVPEGGFVEDIEWQGDGVTLDTDRDGGDALDLADLADIADDGDTSGADDTPDTGNANETPDTSNGLTAPHVVNPINLEPTDRLVIYLPAGDEFGHSRINAAINTFRSRYRDVEVIVERLGDADDWGGEAYIQRVSTELMAGTGPCIILTHFFDDIHKTMDSGAFMNLSPLWHRDADFTAREQLNPVIMDAGVHRGRRYVIPISFSFPLLLSERGVLESVGFDVDAEMDIVSFLNATTATVPAAQQNPLFQFPLMPDFRFQNVIPLVDFENNIALPYEDAIRAFVEAYRPYLGETIDWPQEFWQNMNVETMITDGRLLFWPHTNMPLQIFFSYSRMTHLGYEPYVTGLRNHRGELHATVAQSVAVNANSPNYVNAWKFIRLLLTEQRQYARIGGMEAWGLGHGMPVNTVALNRQIAGVVRSGEHVGTPEGNLFHPALSMEQKQPVIDLIEGISSAALPNRTVSNFLVEAMDSVFEGATSLDDAMDELQRRLRIYLTE